MTRFVTIAVVLALTGAAAGAQNAPPLTPQQKQDLSGYNFKGAEAALQAQSNQPATKQESLTPIPPLKGSAHRQQRCRRAIVPIDGSNREGLSRSV